MKRLCLLLIVPLLLTGCFGGSSSSESEEVNTKKCTLVSDQSISGYVIKTSYEIYSTDGIVDKIEQIEMVESKDKSILNYFKDQYKNQYKSANDKYGGYTSLVIMLKRRVVGTVTIDYDKFDMKKFANDNPGMEGYINKDNRLTLDGSLKMYTSIGATCK